MRAIVRTVPAALAATAADDGPISMVPPKLMVRLVQAGEAGRTVADLFDRDGWDRALLMEATREGVIELVGGDSAAGLPLSARRYRAVLQVPDETLDAMEAHEHQAYAELPEGEPPFAFTELQDGSVSIPLTESDTFHASQPLVVYENGVTAVRHRVRRNRHTLTVRPIPRSRRGRR